MIMRKERETLPMAASAFYVWERTRRAVRSLAGGAGSLRERPSSAWWDNLRELMGHPIPWPDLREKFDRIGERLMPEISSAPDAMHKMRDGELTEIAGEIVDLYDTLCAHTARTSEDTAARPAVWLGDARQSR